MACTDACLARVAELEGMVGRERADKETALSACQALQDRVDFIEPMYWAARRNGEGLWAANIDLRARLRGSEAKITEISEERNTCRSAAALIPALREELAAEKDARARLDEELRVLIGHLRADNLTGRVVYRNGPNRPPSARRAAPPAADAAAGGAAPSAAGRRAAPSAAGRRAAPGRPGGRPGHKGHGRSCKPTRTENHLLPRNVDGTLALQPCRCGNGHWNLVDGVGRIIMELRMGIENVKHNTERAQCSHCGRMRPAVDGLPATGTWDRNMYGFAGALRSERMPAEGIARLLTDMSPDGIVVVKSTVIEGLKRACDASRPYSEAILSKVRASSVVYEDESTTPMVYTRLTAERSEMLAVAGSVSSAMIGAIPPDGLPAVRAVDPLATSWAASALAPAAAVWPDAAASALAPPAVALASAGPDAATSDADAPPAVALAVAPASAGPDAAASALALAPPAVAPAPAPASAGPDAATPDADAPPAPAPASAGPDAATPDADAPPAPAPASAGPDAAASALALAPPAPAPASAGPDAATSDADAPPAVAPAVGLLHPAHSSVVAMLTVAAAAAEGVEAADWRLGVPAAMGGDALGASALGASALGASALGASALGASALGASALGASAEAAIAVRGLSVAAMIDAAARIAAGIGPDEDKVGAEAEACLRDGSANGIGWAWVYTSGPYVAYRFGLTRAGIMHDRYMAGFEGILVADRYCVYRTRFEEAGRLQLCWAHEIRSIAEAALRPGSTLAVRRLHRDVKGVFGMAKDMVAGGAPRTRALRLVAERELDDVLDRYRGCGKEDAERIVAMLDRDKRSLFTFVEHDGVEPTNNRAERALRYVVLLRKIFGQIKGGRRSMERWAHLASCVRTWRAQGKSVMAEISRIM